MYIVKYKRLEKKVNEVEVFGVRSTFHGYIVGVISDKNERNFNVVIASNLEGINPEDYVFPIVVNRERAEKLYNKLK